MNAAAKGLARQHDYAGSLASFVISKQVMPLLLSILLVLISAFSIVYERESHRHVMADYQSLIFNYDQMQSQQKQLILEQSTWANSQRIQRVAENNLGMIFPRQQQTVVVHL